MTEVRKAPLIVEYLSSSAFISVIFTVLINLSIIAFFFGGLNQHIEELDRRLSAYESLQRPIIAEIHINALKTAEGLSTVLQRTVAIETKLELAAKLVEKHFDVLQKQGK